MPVISGQVLPDNPELQRPTMPAIYAAQLIKLSSRFSVSARDLLEGTGMTAETIDDPEAKLSPYAMGILATRAIELTKEPGLGFYFGLHLKLPSHGAVGLAAMTSATLRDAISIAERFAGLRTTHLTIRHYLEGERAIVELVDVLPHGVLKVFVTEALFTALVSIARTLLGRNITGMFEMAFPEPKHFQGFAHLLPGPVRFSQTAHRLIFPSSMLDESLQMADEVARRQAVARCEAELESLRETSSLLSSVRRQMLTRRGGFPSLTELAKQRHVSPRTLKRQLQSHGTSFQQLLDELRRDRALSLLEDETQSVEKIARELGYSDASNFNRAFRRWLSQSPSSFRESLRREQSSEKEE